LHRFKQPSDTQFRRVSDAASFTLRRRAGTQNCENNPMQSKEQTPDQQRTTLQDGAASAASGERKAFAFSPRNFALAR
jgi:hypothetical protein